MWILGWLSSSYLLVDRSTKNWGPIIQKCLLKFKTLGTNYTQMSFKTNMVANMCVKKRPYHLFDHCDLFDKDEIENLIKMIHNCHDQIMFCYHTFKSGQNNLNCFFLYCLVLIVDWINLHMFLSKFHQVGVQ